METDEMVKQMQARRDSLLAEAKRLEAAIAALKPKSEIDLEKFEEEIFGPGPKGRGRYHGLAAKAFGLVKAAGSMNMAEIMRRLPKDKKPVDRRVLSAFLFRDYVRGGALRARGRRAIRTYFIPNGN